MGIPTEPPIRAVELPVDTHDGWLDARHAHAVTGKDAARARNAELRRAAGVDLAALARATGYVVQQHGQAPVVAVSVDGAGCGMLLAIL